MLNPTFLSSKVAVTLWFTVSDPTNPDTAEVIVGLLLPSYALSDAEKVESSNTFLLISAVVDVWSVIL